MQKVNGTLVDHNGAVEIAIGGEAHRFVGGTAHDVQGRMLIAEDSGEPGAVHAGIRHTREGFRCVSEGAVAGYTVDGFAIDASGAQVITREAPTRRLNGLGVDDDGRLCIHDE